MGGTLDQRPYQERHQQSWRYHKDREKKEKGTTTTTTTKILHRSQSKTT
jgi:hypothetical protein